MSQKLFNIILISNLLLLGAACTPATQNIPVSTVPPGAQILADGNPVCTSPCSVELVKTQAHIITIQKPGYRQVDVPVKQIYNTGAVARQAVSSGTWAADTGASTEGAISNALMSSQSMEESGDAYDLSPTSIVAHLIPNHAQAPATPAAAPVQQTTQEPTQSAQAEQPIVISSDQLDPADQQRLRQEPVTITPDQVAPANQGVVETTQPATMEQAVEDNPDQAAEALLEAGAAACPTVGTKKKWKSSHSSESFGSDGSYSKSTSSSSVGVGVSVNPAEAGLGLLHLLEDAKKPNEPETGQ